MYKLYTWKTPNGRKVPILLEELGLAYEVKAVDLSKGEQFAPEFLAISPNNKIPALVDDDAEGGPLAIFESGAILTYLAEKHQRFLAPAGPARFQQLEWLHWQVSAWGPMLGQLGFFAVRSKEKAPLAISHFTEEGERLVGVLEKRLLQSRYLGGDDYSIADIATYPWAVAATTVLAEALKNSLGNAPSFLRWQKDIGARPAVAKGMKVLE